MGPSNTKITRNQPRTIIPTRDEIEKANKQKKVVSLILLGAGESGKTTILKQMNLLHGNGFTDSERITAKGFINSNIVEGALSVTNAIGGKVSAANLGSLTVVENYHQKKPEQVDNVLPQQVVDAILALKSDPAFIVEIEKKQSHLMPDGWSYLADSLKDYPKWGGKDWTPSDKDILNCRVRTTGANDHYFKVGELIYRMVDVGGQKSERKKYMNMFKDMQGCLFVCALSDYNLTLFEDPTESRLIDSLNLFKSIATSDVFFDAALLVFMNKFDIFQAKYYKAKIALPSVPNFETPPTADNEADEKCDMAVDWFKGLYLEQVPEEKRMSVYFHVTTAVDTKLMDGVIKDVSRHIVTTVLGDAGLLPTI